MPGGREPIAQITLILVLFVDASTLNLKALMKDRRLPMRLLFVGLPLTMVLGILLAVPLFPGIDIWSLALMALILSPTDAALGLSRCYQRNCTLTNPADN